MTIKTKPASQAYRDNYDKIFSKWYDVNECLPEDGTLIEGKNSDDRTWQEVFDSNDNVGRMIFWRYV